MIGDDDNPKGFSLRRWSQRKLEAARAVPAPSPAPAQAMPSVASADAAVAAPPPAAPATADPAANTLPPVDSLTFDSDFTAWMQPKVEESLKRQALKKLFQDPHFNVMDGLDTYIADYSIEDPIPPEMLKQLLHARYIFDPPKTRINADGHVEDVPPEEAEATAEAEAAVEPEATVPEAIAAPAPGYAGAQPGLLDEPGLLDQHGPPALPEPIPPVADAPDKGTTAR